MQRAAGSYLPGLFASTEHAPVVCLVLSASLCPSFLCISSRLGLMVCTGRSFPSRRIFTADAQISVLYIRKLLHATLQAWWQTSSIIFQGLLFMIFFPNIKQKVISTFSTDQKLWVWAINFLKNSSKSWIFYIVFSRPHHLVFVPHMTSAVSLKSDVD